MSDKPMPNNLPGDIPSLMPGEIVYTPADTQETVVRRIFVRYYGQFEKIDFTNANVRSQIALDLGYLLGLAMRLLTERQQKDAAAKDPS